MIRRTRQDWYGVLIVAEKAEMKRLAQGKRGQALLFENLDEANKAAFTLQKVLADGFWAKVEKITV